ncbi:MAG: hypothetical protein HFE57_08150 [Firmicutes bacterium]|jgi:hypothetical protein|nr:hypothetical protein [Bacillota bacterium]
MKKLFLAIFIILFPYSIVLLITSLFHTTLMKYLFHNNIYIGVFYIGTLWIIALISAIFICIKNIINNNNALETAKINMIIKILQIPAYIFIFIIGLACLFTIFTFGISFLLITLDCASIFLTGIIGVSAVKCNYTEKILSSKELFLYSILQFVFCADIVSAVILYQKSKSANILK